MNYRNFLNNKIGLLLLVTLAVFIAVPVSNKIQALAGYCPPQVIANDPVPAAPSIPPADTCYQVAPAGNYVTSITSTSPSFLDHTGSGSYSAVICSSTGVCTTAGNALVNSSNNTSWSYGVGTVSVSQAQSDFSFSITWAPIPVNVPGCMDPSADNYNSNATVDDGSCTYPPDPPGGSINVSVSPSGGLPSSTYSTTLSGACGGGCEVNVGATPSAGSCGSATLASGCPNFQWQWSCTAPAATGPVTVTGRSDCGVDTAVYNVNNSGGGGGSSEVYAYIYANGATGSITIPYNTSALITWDCGYRCSMQTGGAEISNAETGSYTTPPLTSGITYTLFATSEDYTEATDESVTVNVLGSAPGTVRICSNGQNPAVGCSSEYFSPVGTPRTFNAYMMESGSWVDITNISGGVWMMCNDNPPCTPDYAVYGGSRNTVTLVNPIQYGSGGVPINFVYSGDSDQVGLSPTVVPPVSPISVVCSASVPTAHLGQLVTWYSSVSGGTPPYTYYWGGTNIPNSPAPNTPSFDIRYGTIGRKNARLKVDDANGVEGICPTSEIRVIFSPLFEEF